MKYALGFDERCNDIKLLSSTGDVEYINTYSLLNMEELQAISLLQQHLEHQVKDKLKDGDELITSNEVINQAIRSALSRGYGFSSENYDRINLLITKWILFFRLSSVTKCDYLPIESFNDQSASCLALSKWKNGFYGRYGIIELRVIDNWLRDKNKLHECLNNVKPRIIDEDFMYSSEEQKIRRHWLDSSDASFNLRKLMTNAGYYPSFEDSDNSFESWNRLYFEATKSVDALFPAPGCYPNFFNVQDVIFHETGRLVNYTNFPTAYPA